MALTMGPKPNQPTNKQTNKQTNKTPHSKQSAKWPSIPPCIIPLHFTTFFFSFVRKKLIHTWNAKRPRYSPNIQIPSLLTWRWLQRRIGRLWTPLSTGSNGRKVRTPNGMVVLYRNSLIFSMFNKSVFFWLLSSLEVVVFSKKKGFSPMNYIIRGLAPYPPCFLFKGVFLIDCKAD